MEAGVGWELAEGWAIDGARGWLCVELPLAAVPFVLWPFAWRLRTSLSGLATEFAQFIQVEVPTCGKIACGRRYTRKVFPWCLKVSVSNARLSRVAELTRPFMALEVLRLLEAAVTNIALSDDHDGLAGRRGRGKK